jgi:hypothetical protein
LKKKEKKRTRQKLIEMFQRNKKQPPSPSSSLLSSSSSSSNNVMLLHHFMKCEDIQNNMKKDYLLLLKAVTIYSETEMLKRIELLKHIVEKVQQYDIETIDKRLESIWNYFDQYVLNYFDEIFYSYFHTMAENDDVILSSKKTTTTSSSSVTSSSLVDTIYFFTKLVRKVHDEIPDFIGYEPFPMICLDCTQVVEGKEEIILDPIIIHCDYETNWSHNILSMKKSTFKLFIIQKCLWNSVDSSYIQWLPYELIEAITCPNFFPNVFHCHYFGSSK